MRLSLLWCLLLYGATVYAQTPCGTAGDTTTHVAPNYLTQTPPAKGALTYTDSQYHCQIIRATNGLTDYPTFTYGIEHEYIASPINVNDTYLIAANPGNAASIYAIPSGALVHSSADANLPNMNNMPRWRHDDPDKFIYFSTNQLKQYSVAGDNSTVLHTFTEYTAVNFGGSHSSIASSVKFMSMEGQLPAGNWECFAYDYLHNIKKTAVALQPTNPTGVTVSVQANSGTSSITFAKAGGTGSYDCSPLQQGACQFTVAGDATVYSEITSFPTLTAGGTATYSITPNFAVNETAGSAVTLLWKPNDFRIIGENNLFTGSSGGGSVTLYNINMASLNTVSGLFIGWPHSDSGVDPVNGHATLYADASADIGTPPCGGSNSGLDKIDLTTGVRTCLLAYSFNIGGHYSLTADGNWIFIHTTNTIQQSTTCLNADLPGNWASLWGPYYNELILVKTDGTAAYRQGYHYSRLYLSGCLNPYIYEWDPRVAISYSGKYGVFDSNFDMNPTVTSGALYTDVYLLSTGLSVATTLAPNVKVTSGVSIK